MSKTLKLVISALMASMACVATMVIKIPIPATGGYINLGDSIVLLASVALGPVYGGLAAGLGSALADLLGGYVAFAPATFIIKALMKEMIYPWDKKGFSLFFQMPICRGILPV